MSTTPVVQPHHLRRKAVIYIRQSTGHQVLTNIESQQLQRAMREQAHHLGWPDERIEIVETDLNTGVSFKVLSRLHVKTWIGSDGSSHSAVRDDRSRHHGTGTMGSTIASAFCSASKLPSSARPRSSSAASKRSPRAGP